MSFEFPLFDRASAYLRPSLGQKGVRGRSRSLNKFKLHFEFFSAVFTLLLITGETDLVFLFVSFVLFIVNKSFFFVGLRRQITSFFIFLFLGVFNLL